MNIKVTFVMDKKENIHVFTGNVQRQIKTRGDYGIVMINGHHRSGLCYEKGERTWYRLLAHFGPAKWSHLLGGAPIVDDTFDFGTDANKLNGRR